MKSLLSAGVALALAAVPVLVAAPVSATTITTVHRFDGTTGSLPGKIIVTGNGTIYGTTYSGGANGTGNIYSIDSAGTFTNLHSFASDGNGGAVPASLALVRDASGTLFGAAEDGGTNGTGTLFSLSSSGTFTKLRDFGAGGNTPTGLIMDAAGNSVTALAAGGQNNTGGLRFNRPDLSGSNVTLAADGSQGRSFTGGIVGTGSFALDGSAGSVFATTLSGGANNGGTLLHYSTTTLQITKLHDFSGATARPSNNLLLNSAGTLFGVSDGTDGINSTVWSRTSAGVFTTLHTFTNGEAASGLFLDWRGTLYGTTYNGGADNAGSLWSRTSSGVFTTLASFAFEEFAAIGPRYGITSDGRGKLFGVTGDFSGDSDGSIWSYDTGILPEPGSWAMLIVGFGLTGATKRRRRAIAARA